MKRVFLIVLDSFGIGSAPDAQKYGDSGANTLANISKSPNFVADNLSSLGLLNIDGVEINKKCDKPRAAYGRLSEKSVGKDTTTGHWEIAGLVSKKAMPTYPHGFPPEIISQFSKLCGRQVICNKPYSGTQVITDFGEQHLQTGALIVYTSADSVFQIAAHTDIVPLEKLYEYCQIARELLSGENAVSRVIARPFNGEIGSFARTPDRRDFSLEPFGTTLLDNLKSAGYDVISVGKISDIFAGRGITQAITSHTNAEGMQAALTLTKHDFNGLCFINLVDFDMLYGHRNDVDGYAAAIARFDEFLPRFLDALSPDDMVIITADHGCDPGDVSTDHTREYIPVLIYGDKVKPVNLGTHENFGNIGKTIADIFNVPLDTNCPGFARDIIIDNTLCELAQTAMENSYSPYSSFAVGAALLCDNGEVFTGCNIENSAFSPTVCAERTAFFKAISGGVRGFKKIAIAGGKNGVVKNPCPPCGVCRQVMSEFCGSEFEILLVSEQGFEKHTLGELLPQSFNVEKV